MNKPRGSLISHFSRLVTRRGGINLAQGKPGFSPPERLIALLKEFADDPALHQYAPGNGDHELLEMILRSHEEAPSLDEDNLVVVQGATEGLFLTFFYLNTVLSRPYSVLSCDPPYESYPELAGILGVPYVRFDLAPDMSIDFGRLEKTILDRRVKIVFLASPGNPLGKVWNAAELTALLRLACRHDFYLIFDAVYRDIYFGKPPANPLAELTDRDIRPRLFYIHSFSKMLSITGWRVGYVIADRGHMTRIRAIHDYTGLSAPSLLQRAIAAYLKDSGHGSEYVEEIRQKCQGTYHFLAAEMRRLGFNVPDIQGGYFLWARLPRGWSDGYLFADRLYTHARVGVVPGENFSAVKREFIRLNMAAGEEIIRLGAAKIADFVRSFPEQR